MPKTTVAIRHINRGIIQVIAFPTDYRTHIEDILGPFDEPTLVEFPRTHTMTLPEDIRKGRLGKLVSEGSVDIGFDQYPLHIYKGDYRKIYRKVKRLSKENVT